MRKEDRKKLDNARRQFADELRKFREASKILLRPLRELNDTQVAAVVTLAYSMRILMLAGRPAAKLNKAILSSFEKVVDDVCPPLTNVTISKDPCFEASVAYVSELAKCEKEGRTEAECPAAWSPGGQAVMCLMKEVENMKGIIEDIFSRFEPPKPIPWPD